MIALCAGKDCRKRGEFAKVRHAVDERCVVIELKCVGICSGPVVVAHPTSETPLVLSKLRSKQDRKLLVRLVDGDRTATKQLSRLAVSKNKRTAILRRVRRATT